MASKIFSEEFNDLQLWNSIALTESDELSYSFSDSSNASIGSCSSSQTRTSAESPTQSHFYTPSVYHSGNVQSPQDALYGCQLLSTLEDRTILDPELMDKERRREQNRVAQRAFRERKESKLKQLEKKIAVLKAEQRQMEKKYQDLRTAHLRLQSGLKILLDASVTFDNIDAGTDGFDSNLIE